MTLIHLGPPDPTSPLTGTPTSALTSTPLTARGVATAVTTLLRSQLAASGYAGVPVLYREGFWYGQLELRVAADRPELLPEAIDSLAAAGVLLPVAVPSSFYEARMVPAPEYLWRWLCRGGRKVSRAWRLPHARHMARRELPFSDVCQTSSWRHHPHQVLALTWLAHLPEGVGERITTPDVFAVRDHLRSRLPDPATALVPLVRTIAATADLTDVDALSGALADAVVDCG